MKLPTILTCLALASTINADSTPYAPPTRVARDVAIISSVVARVSAAIVQLDTHVQAFQGDATQVQTDASSLVNIITSGVTSISASDNITLADAANLQAVVASMQTSGQSLVNDLDAKKTQFEQAGLCSTVLSAITSISSASKSLIDAVVVKVPTDAQTLATSLATGLQTTLNQGAASFASNNCTNAAVTGSSGTSSTGVSGVSGVTVTVTAPCACSEKTTSVATITSASTSSVRITSAISVTSTATIRSSTTIRNNSTIIPTGGSTTTSRAPVVTAGAAANIIGSAGLVAGVFAAFMM